MRHKQANAMAGPSHWPTIAKGVGCNNTARAAAHVPLSFAAPLTFCFLRLLDLGMPTATEGLVKGL